MYKIGFSTGDINEETTISHWLKSYSKLHLPAIELGFTRAERLFKSKFEPGDTKILQKFGHISLHAPVKYDDEFVRYPSKKSDEFEKKLINTLQESRAQYILFHPDLVDNFDYLDNLYGDKLVFENMDNRKPFGKIVSELEMVFEKLPNAKWVCDINHIFTNDKSMKSAKQWHEQLGNKLVYYHISAFGGFHSLFIDNTDEINILNGLLDKSKPMIHEGLDSVSSLNKLTQEIKLINQYLDNGYPKKAGL